MNISILEYFEKTASEYPDKIGIIDRNREITLSEIRRSAQNIALNILSVKNVKNKPVAVFLPKSIESVISDIGITYSGNCYMNLDIKTPLDRIGKIIDRVRPVIIITDKANFQKIQNVVTGIFTIFIEDINYNAEPDVNRLSEQLLGIIDVDPLCIINTSGSTGTPKGAVLNHRNYIDYTQWAIKTFNFSKDEVLGVLSPIVFDHYNYEICLMMTIGCTLVLIDNQLATFPVEILKEVAKNEVTYIFWVPSIMVSIANMGLLDKIDLSKVKMVWFAGEVFPTKQFNYWRKNLPQATFVNLYGPVETSVDCTYYIIRRDIKDNEPIPIGFPCRNTDIIILNEKNEVAAINEEGELCVRGSSVSMGYYNNREKTNEAFVQNPLNDSYPEIIYRTGDVVIKNENGEIVFKGRKDTLIKHMGYRIELAEIEHVIINDLKIIKNGCVVYNTLTKEIVLFYESKEEISVADFKIAIGKVFPKYMVPTRYIKVENMPRNTNGKIDRLLLSNTLNNENS